MRFKATTIVAVTLTLATAITVVGADQPANPHWQKIAVSNGEVVIFGNIARGGYYELSEKGLSLKQLVIAAGLPEKLDGLVIQLRRHRESNEAKVLELKMDALNQGGDIKLEPNDIVQVFTAKAG